MIILNTLNNSNWTFFENFQNLAGIAPGIQVIRFYGGVQVATRKILESNIQNLKLDMFSKVLVTIKICPIKVHGSAQFLQAASPTMSFVTKKR